MQDGQKEFQCCLHYLILVALERAGGCRGTKMQDRGRRSHVLVGLADLTNTCWAG